MKTKILLTVLLSIGIITISNAQIGQRARVRQGVRSGELTRVETTRLRHEQRETRRDRKHARKDGVITPRERKELRKDKRQNSRMIFRKKHNRRERRF